jgi:putative spermidine/putrescine transport system ATP-binding protein
MLSVTSLSKRYGTTTALDHLTLAVPTGTVFGLLRPNASGKSTLIKLLMGFIFPDQGQIDLGGVSRTSIGYVPERPHLPPGSRIGEYLVTAGHLAGMSGDTLRQEVARCLQTVGLAQVANWRIRACSKGMLQRLALAQALLGDPPMLALAVTVNELQFSLLQEQTWLLDTVLWIASPVATMLSAGVHALSPEQYGLALLLTLVYAGALFSLAAVLFRRKDLLWVE